VKSHFILSKADKLKLRQPALGWTGDTAALDFRYERRKRMWDRSGKWKREKPGPKGAPLPGISQDGLRS